MGLVFPTKLKKHPYKTLHSIGVWGYKKHPHWGTEEKRELRFNNTPKCCGVLCLSCSVPNLGEKLNILLFNKIISLPN